MSTCSSNANLNEESMPWPSSTFEARNCDAAPGCSGDETYFLFHEVMNFSVKRNSAISLDIVVADEGDLFPVG
jgi:hypothetical protein